MFSEMEDLKEYSAPNLSNKVCGGPLDDGVQLSERHVDEPHQTADETFNAGDNGAAATKS